MNIAQAREFARRWVHGEAGRAPGSAGAFLSGSAIWLPEDAELPQTSDVDIWIVHDGTAPAKGGKRVQNGILLDVAHIPAGALRSTDDILGNYRLASSFARPNSVLADPRGELGRLHAAVSKEYARRAWVRRRIEDAFRNVRRYVRSFDETAPLEDQVMSWAFAAGVTTHVPLVAALRNPTVRRRYAAVRDVLAEYGLLDVHESLLELIGARALSAGHVARHIDALAEAFDAATAVIRSPFPFAGDITAAARPIAIDGSREMVAEGDHREAAFWIAVTQARCQQVLRRDGGPGVMQRHEERFRELLADLGFASPEDLRRGVDAVEAFFPRLAGIAEQIVAANRAIED